MTRLRLLALLLTLSGVARATKTYPEVVQTEWELAAIPQCTLCHLTNEGQENTVRHPFGLSVLDHNGTGGGNKGSIRAALKAMLADETDSDADGVTDYDELRGGGDPNVFDYREGGAAAPPPADTLPPPFETGCSVAISTHRVTDSRIVAGLTLMLALVRLSRRKEEKS
jgi:hypothetical protein